MATFEEVETALRNEHVRDLVKALRSHFDDVIQLTNLLKGYVGEE